MERKENRTLSIRDEVRDLLPPHAAADRAALEASILRDGCREPILVYDDVIVDGHARYEICQKHGIPFETRPAPFRSWEEMKARRALYPLEGRNLDTTGRCDVAYEIEEMLRPAANVRRKAGTKARGRGAGQAALDTAETIKGMSEADAAKTRAVTDLIGEGVVFGKGDARDKAANAAGISRGTYAKYKEMRAAGRDDLIDQTRGSDAKLTIDGAHKEHRAAVDKEKREREIGERRKKAEEMFGGEEDGETLRADRPRWLRGEFQKHIGSLPDGSVRLLLTDPPYGMDYQAEGHERIAGDLTVEEAAELLAEMLTMIKPKLAADAHLIVFAGAKQEPRMRQVMESFEWLTNRPPPIIWAKNNSGQGDTLHTFAPMYEVAMHATVGDATLSPRPNNVFKEDKVDTSRHPTEKPVSLLQQIIQATTTDGELVADPFGGVASSLVAAAEIGRRAWGCELEGKYHAEGEDRLNKLVLEGARPVFSLMSLGTPELATDATAVDARALAAALTGPPGVVWGWGEPPEELLDGEDEGSQPAGEPEAKGERAEAEAGVREFEDEDW